jgi:hypothetical protein
LIGSCPDICATSCNEASGISIINISVSAMQEIGIDLRLANQPSLLEKRAKVEICSRHAIANSLLEDPLSISRYHSAPEGIIRKTMCVRSEISVSR